MRSWKLDRLLERFGGDDDVFKVGESDKGNLISVPLKQYIEYTLYNRDDSPLYLFEQGLDKTKKRSKSYQLRADYEPPKYFTKHLFNGVDKGREPPHRWFLIGPKRSGSNLH